MCEGQRFREGLRCQGREASSDAAALAALDDARLVERVATGKRLALLRGDGLAATRLPRPGASARVRWRSAR